MEQDTIFAVKLHDNDPKLMPKPASEIAAGFDLRARALSYSARLDEEVALNEFGHTTVFSPGQTVLIKTGVFIALQPGWEAQVRPRSGLALKHGITVLNAPGTIDARQSA